MSADEGAGAFVRLTWPAPREIDRIWLFDRPEPEHRILAGRLRFSDHTTLDVCPLPEGTNTGLEIRFPARQVTWVQFMVTEVSATTQAAGLSEFAVFSPDPDGQHIQQPEYANPPGA